MTRHGPSFAAVRRRLLIAVAACAAIGLMACSAVAVDAPAGAQASVASAREALAREIGPATCSADAQCRTVAVGRKACGGPQAWWAWSAAQTDGARIADLAERYTAAQTTAAEPGRMSTCSVVSDPGAVCEASRCVLRNGGGAR